MVLKNKFSVFLCNSKGSTELQNIEILKFNDGSIRVTLPDIIKADSDCTGCVIEAFIESMDDLMVVAQIKDIVNNYYDNIIRFELNILGTPYTRYDRVMYSNKTDSFGAKVFSIFVNSQKFDKVTIEDPHSEVILNLIDNSVAIDQSKLFNSTVTNAEEFGKICPDAGAARKLKDAVIYCAKDRDPETGKINGMKIESCDDSAKSYEKFIVIDDICEGGGTFLGLANSLKANPEFSDKSLNLYVTHGIFSNGAISKLLSVYDTIYSYCIKESLYNTLTESQRNKVFFSVLIRS